MDTVREIFDALGGASAVARVLNVGASTASEMKRRGSIPPEYWLLIVNAAERAGIEGITLEALALIHAREKGRLPASVALAGDAA